MAATLFPSILPTDDGEADGDSDTDPSPNDLLGDGVCPWCPSEEADDYDNVRAHAAQAHPDEYDEVR